MPNILDGNGLQTKTRNELLEELTEQYKDIYGADINLGSSTPDGQQLNIFIQAYIDLLDLVNQVYTSFDPDQAIGKTLDQRVALNGIQRQAGTYPIQPINITTDRALTLYGLDQTDEPVYTVSDDEGNEFQLQETQAIGAAGTYTFSFRASEEGAVLTTANTIQNPVTVVLGVTNINNPTSYTTLGVDEETDQDLKLRRARSVSLASQGFLFGLIAALENIDGVNFVAVYENRTGFVDADGIPAHSIWVIVDGGEAEDIATAIYRKRNAGCGMKGDETYAITQVDGSSFTVRWDNVVTEDLYIDMDVISIDGTTPVKTADIITELPNLYKPDVFGLVNINELATIVRQIDANALVVSAGFALSGGGPYTNTLRPSAKNSIFSITSGNINIDASLY